MLKQKEKEKKAKKKVKELEAYIEIDTGLSSHDNLQQGLIDGSFKLFKCLSSIKLKKPFMRAMFTQLCLLTEDQLIGILNKNETPIIRKIVATFLKSCMDKPKANKLKYLTKILCDNEGYESIEDQEQVTILRTKLIKQLDEEAGFKDKNDNTFHVAHLKLMKDDFKNL